MTSLGLVLLVVGAVVAIAEAHYPTHGIAGGTGVLIMAVGAVLAISGLGAGLLVGLLGGVILAAAGAGVLVAVLKRGLVVRQLRVRTGAEGLVVSLCRLEITWERMRSTSSLAKCGEVSDIRSKSNASSLVSLSMRSEPRK